MNFIEKLLFGKKAQPEPPAQEIKKPAKPAKPRKPKEKTPAPILSEKDIATQKGEPYIKITEMDVSPADISTGSFTFDWNDKFIINLIKAGYKQKDSDTDDIMVDRWFQHICRNVALEVYEQQQADPSNRDLRSVNTRNIGDGRSEVS